MTVSKIWVFGEAADGTVSNTTLELLAKARTIADTVEVVTAAGADIAGTVGAHGASKLLTVPGTDGKGDVCDACDSQPNPFNVCLAPPTPIYELQTDADADGKPVWVQGAVVTGVAYNVAPNFDITGEVRFFGINDQEIENDDFSFKSTYQTFDLLIGAAYRF